METAKELGRPIPAPREADWPLLKIQRPHPSKNQTPKGAPPAKDERVGHPHFVDSEPSL